MDTVKRQIHLFLLINTGLGGVQEGREVLKKVLQKFGKESLKMRKLEFN